MNVPLVLRVCAFAIVILAILDPALTSNRRTDAIVAVLPSDSAVDVSLTERVAAHLEDRFDVVRGSFAGAQASVVVGHRIPESASWLPAPTFAVIPDSEMPAMRTLRLDAPAQAPLQGRIPVAADLDVRGAGGQILDVTLRSGSLELDRIEHPIASDQEHVRVALSAVAPTAGPLPLRLGASFRGSGPSLARDLVVEVTDERWSTLFFDPRPSWMSTFVRRALESDPRFEVTSRVVTSTRLGTEFGSPPSELGDRTALAAFDVIVVGAPEGLQENDVAGLEEFLRRDGGSVLFLLDRVAPGAHDRLMRVSAWSGGSGERELVLSRIDPPSGAGTNTESPQFLRAVDVAWPLSLPPGGRVHVGAPTAGEGAGTGVIWSVPVGAGRLLVSGALDAWQFRDPAISGFEEFWRALLAEEHAHATPPVEVRIVGRRDVAPPGRRLEIEVGLGDEATARDAAGEVGATASAWLVSSAEGEADSTHVRLWPDAVAGRFRGTFRAPATPGMHRLVVRTAGSEGSTPLMVDTAAAPDEPDEIELIAAWVGARGGAVRGAGELDALTGEIRAALQRERRPERWHPMRSAWWIVPFALALGGEWWWRRRRGLP